MFKQKYFLTGLAIFILLNIFFYEFLAVYYYKVPFNNYLYATGYHHIDDNRKQNKPFNLINALGAWDAQWYLRIADNGYTTSTEVASHAGQRFLDQYAWAFLPFYPALVATTNIFFNNILLAAFVFSNLILLANFFSTYYIVSKLYTQEIAMRTSFLLLFFPLSIFYHSYYAESVFLFLLLWFGYALIKRNWWIVGMTLMLLYLTKPNGTFLLIPLLYVLQKDLRQRKIQWWRAIGVIILPLLSYVYLYVSSKIEMGNGMFWVIAHDYWGPRHSTLQIIQGNIQTIFHFPNLLWHDYKPSQTEILSFFAGVVLFIFSKQKKYPELWYLTMSLLFAPLVVKNFTSYARYEMVAFPIFIYLATKLKGWWFYFVTAVFYGLLLYISLLFINWAWIE